MKHKIFIWIIAGFFACIGTISAQTGRNMEKQNKAIIEQAFQEWATGKGNVFDLLDDHVEWTITGTCAISKVYTSSKQFIDEAIIPLNKRFKVKIAPKIRNIYADGNTVIVIWDGKAMATDGLPYNNTYSWYMTMKDGRIV